MTLDEIKSATFFIFLTVITCGVVSAIFAILIHTIWAEIKSSSHTELKAIEHLQDLSLDALEALRVARAILELPLSSPLPTSADGRSEYRNHIDWHNRIADDYNSKLNFLKGAGLRIPLKPLKRIFE